MLVYGDYKMYLQDKIWWSGSVGSIWRGGLYVLVPLCSSVSLEHEDHEDILEDFGLLLCCSYLCSEA
jgi:hypothetical protein